MNNLSLFEESLSLNSLSSSGLKYEVIDQEGGVVFEHKAEKQNDEIGFSSLPDVPLGFYTMPNALVRGALFNARKSGGGKRESFENKLICDTRYCKLSYWGFELRQSDLDVLIGILHLMNSTGHDLRKPMPIYSASFIKDLGWIKQGSNPSKKDYDRLEASLKYLHGGTVFLAQYRVKDDRRIKIAEYPGRLIQSMTWVKGATIGGYYNIEMDPKIASIFTNNEYTICSHDLRRKIDGRQTLAKFLIQYLMTSRDPIPESIDSLAEKAELAMEHKNTFRRVFESACGTLVELGFLESYTIDKKKKLHVKRSPLKRVSPNQGAIYDNVPVDFTVEKVLTV